MSDLYADLGVPRSASQEDIRQTFRWRSKLEHPDKCPADAPAGIRTAWDRRFTAVSAAYAVLSDPDRRAEYDRSPPTDVLDLVAFGAEVTSTVLAARAPDEPPGSFARRVAFGAASDVFRAVQTPDGKRRFLDLLGRAGARRPP